MINTTLFKTPPATAKKINRLHRLLVTGRDVFEQVATHVSDSALRNSILSIAQQNNQYATELLAHLETTSSKKTTAPAVSKPTHPKPTKDFSGADAAMLGFCNSNEQKIIVAYQTILQESALYEGLQKMIHYQLNGIQFACTQLKLLRSLKQVRKMKQVQLAH